MTNQQQNPHCHAILAESKLLPYQILQCKKFWKKKFPSPKLFSTFQDYFVFSSWHGMAIGHQKTSNSMKNQKKEKERKKSHKLIGEEEKATVTKVQ